MKTYKITNNEKHRQFLTAQTIEFKVIQDGWKLSFELNDDDEFSDIFYSWGNDIATAKHTAPEILQLPNKYADMLTTVIQDYSSEEGIKVDSILIGTEASQLNCKSIKILPTKAIHLFNIFKNYGKFVEGEKMLKNK